MVGLETCRDVALTLCAPLGQFVLIDNSECVCLQSHLQVLVLGWTGDERDVELFRMAILVTEMAKHVTTHPPGRDTPQPSCPLGQA